MNISLFDAHCDTAFKMALKRYGLLENFGHTDLKRGMNYSPYAQFYALFALDADAIPIEFPHIKGMTAAELFSAELEILMDEMGKYPDKIMLCKTAADAENAALQHKTAAFISIEGAELIGCDISKLEEMFERGVRAINLTWNNPNALVCAEGLTDLGVLFVRRCNELGIIIDVSHLKDAAFWNLIDIASMPLMASHSNSRAVFAHPRNITDEQFSAIVKNGGVAGINLFSDFLGEKPTVNTVVEHIEHFLSLGGEGHVSLGCDFDGCDRLPEGINGIEDITKIYNSLLRLNYKETLINDLFYNNLMRVVRKVCVT